MTAAEFDAVMLLMGQMSEPRRAAARRALVDGETGRSIADYYGWGRSAVGNAETAVWRVYQRYLKAKFAEQHSKQQAGRLLTTRQRK